MLGRCACPECGFHAAHVKINIDKEGKHPFRYCPECGAQYFARNQRQGDMLREKMRPEGTATVSAPATNTPPASEVAQPSAIAPTAEAVLAPVPAAPKRKLVLGVMVPA